MIENERYVDFNRRPLQLLGYKFVSVRVQGQECSSRKKGAKSIAGRDWLSALNTKIEQPVTRGENTVNAISCESANSEIKLSPDVEQLVEVFSKFV